MQMLLNNYVSHIVSLCHGTFRYKTIKRNSYKWNLLPKVANFFTRTIFLSAFWLNKNAATGYYSVFFGVLVPFSIQDNRKPSWYCSSSWKHNQNKANYESVCTIMTCGVAKHKHKVSLSEHNVAIGWSLSERNGATLNISITNTIYKVNGISTLVWSSVVWFIIDYRISNPNCICNRMQDVNNAMVLHHTILFKMCEFH